MGKHWARQEVKHNEMQIFVNNALLWVRDNRQTASLAGGAAAFAALAALFAFYHAVSARNAAWTQLSLAQDYAYRGHPELSFQEIKDLTSQHPGAKAASFGQLFAGDLLYPRGQYKEALESYGKVLEKGEPKALQPLALANTGVTQEAAGDCRQAVQTDQRFLDAYPEHFLAPQVHASLARCLESLGQADQAKSACQKIVLQYPDTAWAAWAQSRLQSPQTAKAAAAPLTK